MSNIYNGYDYFYYYRCCLPTPTLDFGNYPKAKVFTFDASLASMKAKSGKKHLH